MRNGKLEVCGEDGKRYVPTAEEMPKGNTPDENFIAAILGKEKVGSPAIWGLRVIERDRTTTASASTSRSMRNSLTGIVTRIVKDRVAAQVEIQAGGNRIVSLLTREAVDALGLAPGMMAVATVKATNVAVELPSA